MSETKEQLEALLTQNGSKHKGSNWQCLCHDDQNPSASIHKAKDGKWRLHCFVCDKSWDRFDLMDIIAKRAFGTSFKEEKQKDKQISTSVSKTKTYTLQEIEYEEEGKTVYVSTNPRTHKVDLAVVRYDKADGTKTFKIFSPSGEAETFIAKAPTGLLPIFNRIRIEGAVSVVVVEGEKCMSALQKVGIVATTKPGGAQAADKVDWSPLYGKTVYLWPDNDSKGLKYMESVRELLLPHCKVKWIEPKKYQLGEKQDCYDYLMLIGWDKQVAQLPLDEATDCGSSGEVLQHTKDIISGKFKSVDWPGCPMLTQMGKVLLPGSTTIFVGSGGAGKSLFLIEAMSEWWAMGVPWAVQELEGSKLTHLNRALAMKVGDGDSYDEEWVIKNPTERLAQIKKHQDFLDEIGKNIIIPNMGIGQKELLVWIESNAKSGKRIIIVDPISIADKNLNGNSWESDKAYVWGCEKIARETGCSIINVSHPRQDGDGPSLKHIAGGMAYPNFSHNVVWFEPIKSKEYKCRGEMGTMPMMCNRIIHGLKFRYGKFDWEPKIGLNFQKNLTFKEYGVIEK